MPRARSPGFARSATPFRIGISPLECVQNGQISVFCVMETRKDYPSDLTDAQWKLLEPWVPAVKEGGRNATYTRREIVNAILYLTRTGCAWRYIPHDMPPWSLV